MRLVALTLAIAVPLAAQEQSQFDLLSTKLRFRLERDGRLQINPDPMQPDQPNRFRDVVADDFGNVWQNGGAALWLAVVYQGNTDLASMADAEILLGKLGLAKRDAVLRLIATEQTASPHEQLLRILAVRFAARTKVEGAAEALEKALRQGVADPHVRRAARESLDTLRGRQARLAPPPTVTIRDLLKLATGRIDYVCCYDPRKMPPAHRLLAWGRMMGLAILQADILAAGGALSLPQVAGASMVAIAPGIAPYELTRRFGNHRVGRVVWFGRNPSANEPEGAHWLRIDGEFDVPRLRQGIAQVSPDTPIGGKPEVLETAFPPQHQLVVNRSTITGRPTGRRGGESLGAAQIDAILEAVGPPDATVTVWLRRDATVPGLDLPPQLTKFGIPERVSVWLPGAPHDRLRIQVVCRTAAFATALHARVQSLVRTAQSWLASTDSNQLKWVAEIALPVLKGLKLHLEDRTISISAPVEGIDPETLVQRYCVGLGR